MKPSTSFYISIGIILFSCSNPIDKADNIDKNDVPNNSFSSFVISNPENREIGNDTLVTDIKPYQLVINNNNEYILSENGKIICKNVLEKVEKIVRQYSLIIENNLYIYYETSYGGGGSAEIVSIDINSNKILWKTDIVSFNICQPIMKDKYIYLAANWIVAKINKVSGKLEWSHNDINDFELVNQIVPVDNTIVFTCDNGKQVVVNDADGSIIK